LRADATFKAFVVKNVKPESAAAADAAAVERDEMLAELELSKSDPRTTTALTGESVRAEVNVIALAEQSTPVICTKTASDSIGEASEKDPVGAFKVEKTKLKQMGQKLDRLFDLNWATVPLYPRGVKNSLGVVSNGKIPFGGAWQETAAKNARDRNKAKAWYVDALNYMRHCPNVGVLNGCELPLEAGEIQKSYLLIVDFDVPEGTTYEGQVEAFEKHLGCKLPSTVADRSPRGGGRIFLWTNEDVACAIKLAIIDGVDYPIQAAIWPSVIGDKAYAWQEGRAPWERSLAEAPPALCTVIKQARVKVSPPLESFSSEYCDKWSIRRAINRFRALEDIHGQKHHSRMAAIAASLNDGVTPDYLVRIQEKHVCWADAHHADSSNESFTSQMDGIARGRLLKGIPLGVSHPRHIEQRDALRAMKREAERVEFLESGDFDLSDDQAAKASAPQPPEQRERVEKERQAKAEREAARENAERVRAEKAAPADAETEGGEKAEKAKTKADPIFEKYRIGHIGKKTVTPPRYLVKGHLNRGATSVWFGPPKGGKSGTITHLLRPYRCGDRLGWMQDQARSRCLFRL
jgi:hypothetical protein